MWLDALIADEFDGVCRVLALAGLEPKLAIKMKAQCGVNDVLDLSYLREADLAELGLRPNNRKALAKALETVFSGSKTAGKVGAGVGPNKESDNLLRGERRCPCPL